MPPRAETVVPISCCLPKHTVGLISPASQLRDKYQLLAAHSFVWVSERNTIPFCILNPHPFAILLYPNTVLGEIEISDNISTIDPGSLSDTTNLVSSTSTTNVNIDFDLTNSNLSETEKEKLRQLLSQYSDLFANNSNDLGRTSLIPHSITVDNPIPIRQHPYRFFPAHKNTVSTHINDMLQYDIIRPSMSPWSSPVIIIPKKDGGTRFVVDYHKLNHITKKDSYPLPHIDNSLDCLGGANYFTVLDLCSGYFQIPLDEHSKQFTAFITQSGLYEFQVMPNGLCNAPSTFQRLMEHVLRHLQWQICLIYLDDIIIYSKSFPEHLLHLALVFDHLRDAHLKLKPSKCQFACKSVPYLGFIATPDGIQLDPKKLRVYVHTLPPPV